MRANYTAFCVLLCVSPLTHPLRAQQALARLCRNANTPQVGQWASFTARGGKFDGWRIRVTAVGTETQSDTTFYRVELAFRRERADTDALVMQLLVPNLADGLAGTRSFIVKFVGMSPVRVSDQLLSRWIQRVEQDNPSPTFGDCERAQVLGSDSLTVEAGSFRVLHVQETNCEQWLADGIPFGIVQERQGEAELVLQSYGNDGRSSLTEAPVDMPPALSRLAARFSSAPIIQDSATKIGVARALCDSLKGSELIRPDSNFAVQLLLSSFGPLPGVEERPQLDRSRSAPLRYPKELAKRGIEGRVVTRFIVGTNGNVEPGTIKIIATPSSQLGLAAETYVAKLSFRPARLCGQPVRVLVQLPVDYTLRH